MEKNRKNREHNMKRKRAENSLDENCEAIEKKRAYHREYLRSKRARESENSDAIEKKRAQHRKYMRNKRAGESENSEASENICRGEGAHIKHICIKVFY